MPTADFMIDTQLLPPHRGITNSAVLAAMRSVPREQFVPPLHRGDAYADRALPIDEGQTISQPFIVAFMTEAITPRSTDRVLEIGTGSGYQTAILAEIVDSVFSIETHPKLARSARRKLEQLGYDNISFREGNGYSGWPEKAPFDAIIATCAPATIPLKLVEQLREGGQLIVPIGPHEQCLKRITRQSSGLKTESLLDVRFVPMLNPPHEA